MKELYHGSAYYPEQWGLEYLDQDIAYMKELGLNNVRMMEFAWSVIEKEEGKFDFSLFDAVIDKLHENAISVMLCTPTATPPRWFTLKYPDSLVVDKEGKTLHHGSREHVCMNHPALIEKSKIITRKIAEHYAKHPAIMGYQLHNEPGMPTNQCYCESCKNAWGKYLQARYKTVENLNDKWGNNVWSFTYPTFESVPQPLVTPYLHSASHTSCYRQFASQTMSNFLTTQAEIIREYTSVPICTNVSRTFDIDFDTVFECLDFVGLDDYSTFDGFPDSMLNYDRFRNGYKKPYYVVETPPTSGGNIVEVLPFHHKHYVQTLATTCALGGGMGFNYWTFKQPYGGAELGHGHIVSACGKPSPAFQNVKEASQSLKKYADFIDRSKICKAKVAFVYSDVSNIFSQTENYKEFHYYIDALNSYRNLVKTCVYRDVLTEKCDFTGYDVIYAPYVITVSDTLLEKLKQSAQAGATVIFGAYTGTRTQEHTVSKESVLAGIETVNPNPALYFTQLKGQGDIQGFGATSTLKGHTAVFNVSQNSKASICGGYCDGLSVVEEVPVGKGKFVYAIFKPDDVFEVNMLQRYIDEKSLRTISFDYGIAYFMRDMDGKLCHCFTNMDRETRVLHTPKQVALQSGETIIIDETGGIIEV